MPCSIPLAVAYLTISIYALKLNISSLICDGLHKLELKLNGSARNVALCIGLSNIGKFDAIKRKIIDPGGI